MPYEPALSRVIAPPQRQHVAVHLDDNGLNHRVGSWNQNGTRNGVPKKTAGLACLWIGLRRCLGKHAVFGAAQEMSCRFILSQRKVVVNRAKLLKLSSFLHCVF